MDCCLEGFCLTLIVKGKRNCVDTNCRVVKQPWHMFVFSSTSSKYKFSPYCHHEVTLWSHTTWFVDMVLTPHPGLVGWTVLGILSHEQHTAEAIWYTSWRTLGKQVSTLRTVSLSSSSSSSRVMKAATSGIHTLLVIRTPQKYFCHL